MFVRNEVRIENSKIPSLRKGLASNVFANKYQVNITIYLENLKFRKNVNYIKVSNMMISLFLCELICAMSRWDTAFMKGDLNYTLCGHGGTKQTCPIDFIIKEMLI